MRTRGIRQQNAQEQGDQPSIEELRTYMAGRALGWRGGPQWEERRGEARAALAEAQAADPAAAREVLADAECFPVARPLQKLDDGGNLVSDPLDGEGHEDICIICQEDMIYEGDSGLIPRELPCKHCFHGQCLGAWLLRSCTCPLCRMDLETSIGKLLRRDAKIALRADDESCGSSCAVS
jgi:hypothetical protein